jgi:hypothetical protein
MEYQYSFDLAFLFSLYPVEQSLLANLPRSSQYTLRFVLRCKGLKGMRREYFVQTAADNGWSSIIKWEDKYGSVAEHLPISVAARAGYIELVKWLLDNKRYQKYEIMFAMKAALESGQEHIVQYLLTKRQVAPNAFTLRHAAKSGNIQLIRNLLLTYGPDSSQPILDLKHGPEILSRALKYKHVELARWLIRRGCFANEKAFYYAGKCGDWEIIGMLKRYGRIHHRTFDGALKSGDVAFVEYVYADIYEPGEQKQLYKCSYLADHSHNFALPLDKAAYGKRVAGHLAVINWLVDKGLQLDFALCVRQAMRVGDVLALERLSELCNITSHIDTHAHAFAAKYKHDHITEWLLANTTCAINEHTYYELLRLFETGHDTYPNLAHLRKWGPPLDADKCMSLTVIDGFNWEVKKALAKVGWTFPRPKHDESQLEKHGISPHDREKAQLLAIAKACLGQLELMRGTVDSLDL